MLQGFRYALALVASLNASHAWSCSTKTSDNLITLNAGWRAQFDTAFDRATGAYLVTVRSAGELDKARPVSCDEYAYPPPPPPPHPSRQQRADYEALEQATLSARAECTAEKVQVDVIETLKGPHLEQWTETTALIDVTETAPKEPVAWSAEGPAYGARVGSSVFWQCSPPEVARRMSVGARYMVFTSKDGPSGTPAYISHAYLVDPKTPFLAETRRLGAAD